MKGFVLFVLATALMILVGCASWKTEVKNPLFDVQTDYRAGSWGMRIINNSPDTLRMVTGYYWSIGSRRSTRSFVIPPLRDQEVGSGQRPDSVTVSYLGSVVRFCPNNVRSDEVK